MLPLFLMSIIPQLIANGIIAGGIYSLVALGYTMVYGILKFINFAHGEVFMAGAYIAWLFNVLFGVNIIIAFLISMIACGLLGFIIEKAAYKPLRNSPRLVPLITAIGVSLFLQALALLIFGADIKTFRTGTIEKGINILGATITKLQITIVIVSLVMMFLLHLFVKYSKTGKAIRAVADNPELASTIGINVDKVISVVFIIGSALAAVAGILIGMEQNLQPTMGVSIGIKAFTAAVVGGIGNIYGALIGGFLIGLIENIGIWFIPSGYKDAIAFFVLLIMLFFRPQGLFGKKEAAERV